MKNLIILLLCAYACADATASENEVRCLKSIGIENPIRLRFDFPLDDGKIAYVTYQKGSGKIQLKNTNTRENRTAPSGRPSEFETEWLETNAGNTGGKYLIKTQGARIYDFKFIRKRDGKVFKFEEDLDAVDANVCLW